MRLQPARLLERQDILFNLCCFKPEYGNPRVLSNTVSCNQIINTTLFLDERKTYPLVYSIFPNWQVAFRMIFQSKYSQLHIKAPTHQVKPLPLDVGLQLLRKGSR
jgi:hypothetical protein